MAGIPLISLASSPVPPPVPPPRRESPPPAKPEGHHRRKDEAEWSPESADLSRALLQKVALEGKDFQTARREIAGEEPDPAPPAPAQPPPSSTPASAASPNASPSVQLDATHVVVDVQTPGASVHVEVTQVHLQTGVPPKQPPPKQDPLLLDLDGNGASTTGAEGAQAFDLAGSGDTRATSFVAGGDAFLALDRNGNGRIDDGRELFGDQHGAVDGFEELRKFDGNADGRIDGQDAVFGSLQLLYADGHTGSLAGAGISAISLGAEGGGTTTSTGDDILRQASALRTDGTSVTTFAMGLQRFDQTV